jgi:hypothetical protein
MVKMGGQWSRHRHGNFRDPFLEAELCEKAQQSNVSNGQSPAVRTSQRHAVHSRIGKAVEPRLQGYIIFGGSGYKTLLRLTYQRPGK